MKRRKAEKLNGDLSTFQLGLRRVRGCLSTFQLFNLSTSAKRLATLIAAAACIGAQAVTVTQVAGGDNKKGLSDSSLWGEEVSSDNDYISTKTLYVSSDTTAQAAGKNTFNGKSLAIGVVGGAAPVVQNYSNGTGDTKIANITGEGGLILANGSWKTRYGGTNIHRIKAEAGGITVTSPATAPFTFGNITTRCGGIIELCSKLKGADTTGILVVSSPGSDASYTGYPIVLEVSGDATDYLGSVVVSNTTVGGAEFRLSGSASYFGGSITMRSGTTFAPKIATSVAALTLEAGAKLSLAAGETLTVRGSLAVEGGPVPVTLEGAPSDTVDAVTRHALITMPSTSACTEADFSVANAGAGYTTAPDVYMEDDGETKTLYAAYYPRLDMLANNNSGTDSAVTNGVYWPDGLAVHGAAHYRVVKLTGTTYISTPNDLESPVVFPGASLYLSGYTALNLYSGDCTVSNVMFKGGSNRILIYGLSNEDVTLRGRFEINTEDLRFITRQSGVIRLSGPCTGTSSSVMSVYGASGGTDQIRETVVLEGDHSGYAGKYLITIEYPAKVVFDSKFLSLRVSEAASLGGPCPEFTYDALKIEHAGRLEAYGSFTLDEPTRGVFVSGQGRFYVSAGNALTLKEQLTVNGRVYKEGAGTLAIGGSLQFLDAGGDLAGTAPAEAANRTLFVTAGTLKPIGARSLDGLDVVFSNVTSKADVALRFDAAPEEVEMGQYGVINLKAADPFAAVIENGGKVPVSFDMPDDAAQQYDVALFTVDASAADGIVSAIDVPAKFVSGGKKYRVTVSQKQVTVDGASAVTIVATVAERVPRGLVISLQ